MYKKLISSEKLKQELPVNQDQQAFILESHKQVKDIFLQKSFKKVIVCGPCSIHDFDLFLDYAYKLKKISLKTDETLFLIIRAYIEKPRTLPGFKGFVYQPHHHLKEDLAQGLYLSRKLFLKLTDLKIPISMEILDPNLFYYFDDLITWGFIGARTSSSQIHRQIASLAHCPIGFKNTLDGNIELAIEGMNFAKAPQNFFHCDRKGQLSWIQSHGNPLTHLVLRGSQKEKNFDIASIEKAYSKQLLYQLSTPIMIDCAHGNSNKNPDKQRQVFLQSLDYFHHNKILGFMLESHIDSQASVTDPCLDFKTTEELLDLAHFHSLEHLASLTH